MRLESALNSSREGLISHGQAISVVGDNISNSSTTGYKSARAEFGDLFSEGGDGHNSTSQSTVGSGSYVQSVRQIHETGTIEFTNRQLDVAVAGNGFITVLDGQTNAYTRAGNLSINESGVLVNNGGLPVLGYSGNTSGTLSQINMREISVSAEATTTARLAGNLSSTVPLTTLPTNPQSFNDVQRAASSQTTVSVFDSLGNAHTLNIYFFKTDTNQHIARAYLDGSDVGGTAGQPVQVGNDATIQFGENGLIAEANKAAAQLTATPAYAGGAAAGSIAVNFDTFTQFSDQFSIKNVTRNGQGAGAITDYEFRKDGGIYAQLDSGDNIQVGTLPLTTFQNYDGLERSGNGLYLSTANSGNATLNAPGTGGAGTISGGALENSTVDVANQFIDLVTYQRGYQANSQVLSAAGELLKTTIGLIR